MITENFVRTIMDVKEKNALDLSALEDLSVALMNLVSLEEHSFFSYVKTNDEQFIEILEVCRELRKDLLAKIVKKDDDSEKWCMSKHLLASSMRLFEVGNRYLHEGNKEEAKKLYKDAAELYGLFFKLNLEDKDDKQSLKAGLFKSKKGSITNYNEKEKKSIFSGIKKLLECCKE